MGNKKQETIDTYNKNAEGLARKFNTIGSREVYIKKGLSYVKNKNPKVVELGCGNGKDAEVILKYTNDYLGIDVSEGMIRLAKANLPQADFMVADIEEFEFPDKIDIIFSFASLLHFDKKSIIEILDRAHNSLDDNGIFYISVKHDKYHEKVKVDEFGSRVFYYYTEKDIRDMTDDKYEMLEIEEEKIKGVNWLQIILRKNKYGK
ncbi:class I SAM-dependent methyltransferase [Patescibacteria group bacterium]